MYRLRSSLSWKLRSWLSKGFKKLKTMVVNKTLNRKSVTNFNEFKKEFEEKGTDPEEVVLLYCIAALEYANGNDDGHYMATLTLPKNFCEKDSSSPSGFKLSIKGELYYLEQIRKRPNIIKSYLGGTPANNYEIDPDNLKLNVVEEAVEKDKAIIVIQSAGKDNNTPMQLKKNKHGYWKIFMGTSSIATGVKVTSDQVDDF